MQCKNNLGGDIAQVWLGMSLGPQGRVSQWGTLCCKVSSCRANLVASAPLMMNQCPSLCKRLHGAMLLPEQWRFFVVKERDELGPWHIWDKNPSSKLKCGYSFQM